MQPLVNYFGHLFALEMLFEFFVRESAKCMCLVDIMMHNCSRANCLTHG